MLGVARGFLFGCFDDFHAVESRSLESLPLCLRLFLENSQQTWKRLKATLPPPAMHCYLVSFKAPADFASKMKNLLSTNRLGRLNLPACCSHYYSHKMSDTFLSGHIHLLWSWETPNLAPCHFSRQPDHPCQSTARPPRFRSYARNPVPEGNGVENSFWGGVWLNQRPSH